MVRVKPQEQGQADKQMCPKLIRPQCSLHIAEKKYACTHMLRSARALPRCISHSAHSCTSLEVRARPPSGPYAKI